MRHVARIFWGILLLSALPATGADSTRGNSDACIEKNNLSRKLVPPVLWKSLASCISAEKYDDGVFIYAMAGAFGAFDKLRVADESAHQATRVLLIATFDSLPADKVAAFKARARQTLGDDSKRKEYCKELEDIGPPDYYPAYMIQHGLGAITGANKNQPLVSPFDPHSAWPQALRQYLQCP